MDWIEKCYQFYAYHRCRYAYAYNSSRLCSPRLQKRARAISRLRFSNSYAYVHTTAEFLLDSLEGPVKSAHSAWVRQMSYAYHGTEGHQIQYSNFIVPSAQSLLGPSLLVGIPEQWHPQSRLQRSATYRVAIIGAGKRCYLVGRYFFLNQAIWSWTRLGRFKLGWNPTHWNNTIEWFRESATAQTLGNHWQHFFREYFTTSVSFWIDSSRDNWRSILRKKAGYPPR